MASSAETGAAAIAPLGAEPGAWDGVCGAQPAVVAASQAAARRQDGRRIAAGDIA
jgi:hypothetical protein